MLKISNNIRKIISFLITLTLILSQFSFLDAAENNNSSKAIATVESFVEEKKYDDYINETTLNQYTGPDITYNAGLIFSGGGKIISNVNGSGKSAVEIASGNEATFSLDVPYAGLYNVKLEYMDNSDSMLPVETSIKINGEYPFYELRDVKFESLWTSPKVVPEDKYGNQIVPMPEKLKAWESKYIEDGSYRHIDPLLIPLNNGNNKLSIKVNEGTLLISKIILSSPNQSLKRYTNKIVNGDNYIDIEAENIKYRNDSSIRPAALFDMDVTPYNSEKRVLNILDSASFKKAGQMVEYAFDVNSSGYYYIGFNYRQDSKINFPVFVNILIDNKLLYEEMKNYPFQYTSSFKNITLKDNNGRNIAIYLEKGKHTISIVLSIDPIRNIVESAESITKQVDELSLKLTELFGSNTDKYRDFEVQKYIPGVKEELLKWADELDELYSEAKKFNPKAKKIGAFSELLIAESQLRSLAKKPNDLPKKISELSTGTGSVVQNLADVIEGVDNNGLALDKIYLYQNEKSIPKNVNAFVKFYNSIKRFVISFTKHDYSTNNVNKAHLQVWVNRPRQYVEILQHMIDESFTPKTNIKVDLSIMPDQNKLIFANAAGNAPDVAMAINYTLPFELGIRGALEDLTNFKDFNSVAKRFPQGLLIPSMIGKGVYSVPETFDFWVLFYRSDILQSLNAPIPNTMNDVIQLLPTLRERGMSFYYPTAAEVSLKSLALTMPLIYQNGGSFYGKYVGDTTLSEEKSIKGFQELTDLFTIYGIPYDVPSFYQEFKDGTLPIGISDYFTYNLLINSAPEIKGEWGIALIPGVVNDKGEILRWSAGGAENDVIFKGSNKKEEAWQFLKWWTDKNTQIQFGNTLQTTYGQEYLWNTSNIEAFKELPWDTKDKKVILEQTKWILEAPRVPGTYMLERELSNAYNSVVLDGKDVRLAIDLACKNINRETYRKLEQFGYIKNGVVVKKYETPKINVTR